MTSLSDDIRRFCEANAAHLATRLEAERLTLLKSTLPPDGCTAAEAAQLGIVDEDFPEASDAVRHIEIVNLRADPPVSCVLR